jgi:hypothetical protein
VLASPFRPGANQQTDLRGANLSDAILEVPYGGAQATRPRSGQQAQRAQRRDLGYEVGDNSLA